MIKRQTGHFGCFQSFCIPKNTLQSSNNFSETKKCWTHGDCPRHLRCTNGYCGDRAYHEALKKRQCEDDSICEVRKEKDFISTESYHFYLSNFWRERCAVTTWQGPSGGVRGKWGLLCLNSLCHDIMTSSSGLRRNVATTHQVTQSSDPLGTSTDTRWTRWHNNLVNELKFLWIIDNPWSTLWG